MSRKRWLLVGVLVVVVWFARCRYVFIETDSGLYRADRLTGKLVLIEGDESRRVKSPEEVAADQAWADKEAARLEAERQAQEAAEQAERASRVAYAEKRKGAPLDWWERLLAESTPIEEQVKKPPRRSERSTLDAKP